MKKDILSWNDVKERYLEFHHLDRFTESMAIDIDFGYWLVNNCTIPHISGSLRDKFASDALNGLMLRHSEPGYTDRGAVNEAYEIADMMMERREQ
ncbi:MAG: hypothetical protein ACOCWC_04845 [Bacteroidota bacterium]